MKSILSLVLVCFIGMATPCCFNDQGSFDIHVSVNASERHKEEKTLNGSVSFDFNQQLFGMRISYDGQFEQTLLLTLDKKAGGSIIIYSRPVVAARFKAEACLKIPFTGTLGKPWQCILDNRNIFTSRANVEDFTIQDYIVNFMGQVVTGRIEMQPRICLPAKGVLDVSALTSGPGTAIMKIKITNPTREADENMLVPPCQNGINPGAPPVEIPVSPDALISILKSAKKPSSRPAGRRQRRCIIPGAFC